MANPVPALDSLEGDVVEEWIEKATSDAAKQGIKGKAVTPFILSKVAELSAGKTLETNKSLLVNNAVLASEIAMSLKCDR